MDIKTIESHFAPEPAETSLLSLSFPKFRIFNYMIIIPFKIHFLIAFDFNSPLA